MIQTHWGVEPAEESCYVGILRECYLTDDKLDQLSHTQPFVACMGTHKQIGVEDDSGHTYKFEKGRHQSVIKQRERALQGC